MGPNKKMRAVTPRIVLDDSDLQIRCLPGRGNQLVLAFTGIHHLMGGIPMDEFRGSASDNYKKHVLFISDMQRVWYSQNNLAGRIAEFVRAYIAEHKIQSTSAVGNSMGGYGAILMAKFVDLKVVAAFSPQISMHQSIIKEKRWADFRPNIDENCIKSLAPIMKKTGTRFYVFCGAKNRHDAAQMALLPDSQNIVLRKIQNSGHGAARHLKKNKILAPVLHAALADDPLGLDALLMPNYCHADLAPKKWWAIWRK